MVLTGLEISGADQEVLEAARQMGCKTVLIAGEQAAPSANSPDVFLQLPTDSLPRLLETTLLIGNLLCSTIEGELFGI